MLQVLVEQGLGKYCDPDFVRNTSREIAEALQMTHEEMDKAAHNILSTSTQHLSDNHLTSSLTDPMEDEYEPRPQIRAGPRPASMVRQPPDSPL